MSRRTYDPFRWFHVDDPDYVEPEPDPDYQRDLEKEMERDEA